MSIQTITRDEVLQFPGHSLATVCKRDWWPPWKPIPCLGIQVDQLLTIGRPWHKLSHIGVHLGNGDVFEVTDPHAKIGSLDAFLHGKAEAYLCVRQVYERDHVFPPGALSAMRSKAKLLCSPPYSKYDRWELIAFLLSDVFGGEVVSVSKLKKLLDFNTKSRVCSTGAALVEEAGRRNMADLCDIQINNSKHGEYGVASAVIPELFDDPMANFGALAKLGVMREPWPRAFSLSGGSYLHADDVKPAHYGWHKDYDLRRIDLR